MGTVASATLHKHGKVHGVIPFAMTDKERKWPITKSIEIPEILSRPVPSHSSKPEDRSILTEVKSMHERKLLMAKLSLAFICLPGGYGTLEELAEMTTWTQLGIHRKPVILLNVKGFFDGLKKFQEDAIAAGFIREECRSFMTFVDEPEDGDWGKAALQAVQDWMSTGLGGGKSLDLKWN